MNKQGPNGIEWANVFGPGTGFTSNVTGGCFHDCEWQMADGTWANCYAENVAEGVASKAYPQGFRHHYWNPSELEAIARRKKPAGIFVGSMADVFGSWVPAYQIEAILNTCRRSEQHIFFFLTKNPYRMGEFAIQIPPNCWMGASIPPTRWRGHQLAVNQKHRMLSNTLRALSGLKAQGLTTWLSAEPLDFNIRSTLIQHPHAIDWCVIGAASQGGRYHPPKWFDFIAAKLWLDEHHVPMFFKGNLKSLDEAARDWRQDYPNAAAEGAVTIGESLL